MAALVVFLAEPRRWPLLATDHVANGPAEQAAAYRARDRPERLVFLAAELVAGDATCNGAADGADILTI